MALPAQSLDLIGVTLLRAMTTNLDGSGIRVAQPEASLSASAPIWEVNPANTGQPAARFTFISAAGSTNVYPNSLSANSWHADAVGNNFYGITNGVAINVAHVDNFDADYFVNTYVFSNLMVLDDLVVNQSFTFSEQSVGDQQQIDSAYDDYSTQYKIIFVSAANNYGTYNPPGSYNTTNVVPPGTAYNCISVGAYTNAAYYNSIGPTIDNGRCKPDITASASATSFSTPQVAGAVAVLMQAGLRGDGGSDTNAASDMRTIKALLLNGAVKPAGWTNSTSSPLDARYGAGILNVFNAYEQLAGGKQNFCAANFTAIGDAHPPVAATNSIAGSGGWDFNTNSTTATNDAVNHYFFNVPSGTVSATLVWNRQLGATNINDLDLFLFDVANSNLVACSTSLVDNVEHIFVPQLASGRYDLQILKNGGTNVVSGSETYALAWAFVAPTLSLEKSGANIALTWPVYPAGFTVVTTTNLAPANWTALTDVPIVITNQQNWLQLDPTNANQFFRLREP